MDEPEIERARCPYCQAKAGPVIAGTPYSIQHRADGSHAVLAGVAS